MYSLKNHYEENGYVIVRNLISVDEIDTFLNAFEIFKKSNSLFFSQSEHNWRTTKQDLDKFGLLNCSIENFTSLIWNPRFSNLGRKILQSKKILDTLRSLSDKNDFCMWQNMCFDKSTGTVDHIDTYYLDTNPMGSLIAGWFALEDIDGRGGAFHIFPKSHLNISNEWQNMNHEAFVNWSAKKTENMEEKVIYLNKGDVLFWHPSLFHGSSTQKIDGFSRKSLTAHYFPIDYLKGGGGKNNSLKDKKYIEELNIQKKSYRSYGFSICESRKKRDIFIFCLKGIAHYFSRINSPHTLMNRDNYDF